jgi:four helix bundle protein
VKDFHELQVWQKAHQLTLVVYQITASLPREELYGLTSQLRRSCSSIAANLAEGCGRNGDAEFARFCSIAMGSASELEYHLLLARDLKLIKPKDYEQLAERTIEVKRMLTGLIQKLSADRLELLRFRARTWEGARNHRLGGRLHVRGSRAGNWCSRSRYSCGRRSR